MKNFIKMILLTSLSSLLLIGCSSKKSDQTIDKFINTLISSKNYENIVSTDSTEFPDELSEKFEEYLTEDALNSFLTNRTPYFYYEVIKNNSINDTTDIKIVKTKEKDEDKYFHYEYEVSYKLKSDDKTIDMKDYMTFKIMKDNPSLINEVYVSDKNSSIFEEYKNIKK